MCLNLYSDTFGDGKVLKASQFIYVYHFLLRMFI